MAAFEIIFLGTCACDFSPRLKGDCKDRFDKDVRRSSSILMNGHILVDCGPHTIGSLAIVGTPLASVTDIFLTHLHDDHFDAENIGRIASAKGEKLRLWVREDAQFPPIANTEVVRMRIGRRYDARDGTMVTPLAANHTAYPQHFIFERGGEEGILRAGRRLGADRFLPRDAQAAVRFAHPRRDGGRLRRRSAHIRTQFHPDGAHAPEVVCIGRDHGPFVAGLSVPSGAVAAPAARRDGGDLHCVRRACGI